MAMTERAPARATEETPRPAAAELVPDPARWAVEVQGLKKHFVSRQGLPPGYGLGSAHWIISSLIKYRKQANWVKAVDGVDLKVGRDELFGLLGPNGAGKTTLIKCLSTLLTTDGGKAYINGYEVTEDPDRVRQSINLVGTGHWGGFDWGLTVAQNLDFFGSLYGLSAAERRRGIDETLELLGLSAFAHQTPRTLSTGERQRMLLAKGFMIRTPVFFLDEPTAGLDPEAAWQVREFVRRELVSRRGTSVILTTHRMAEAEALCSRIAIMDRGRVVACGTPAELKAMAAGSTVLDVRSTGFPLGVLDEIRALPGVKAAALSPIGGESVEESLRLHLADQPGLADRVLDTLRRAGVELRSVTDQEPNLEDAFLALTRRRLEP